MGIVRSVIGISRFPALLVAGLAAATAAAGALAYTVSTIRAAGAARVELTYLARLNRDNAALSEARGAAARDARAAEAGARERAEELRARLRAAARAAPPGGSCGLNDSVREAIESWRAR
ncbi:MAG: hypothetical protein OXC28_07235 [Defluviicoccus sp.]|nr:hypothetical protein [Defluviicoccus sp.]